MDNVYFECSVLKAYNSLQINKDHPRFSIHPYPLFRFSDCLDQMFQILYLYSILQGTKYNFLINLIKVLFIALKFEVNVKSFLMRVLGGININFLLWILDKIRLS